MRTLRRHHWLTGLCLAFLSAASTAADLSPLSQEEVTHLIRYLEQSNCKFGRNGTWHEAKDAAKHLNEKKSYLVNRGSIASAEAFIAKAASQSALTGSPYLVQCPGVAVAQSAPWLELELTRFRQARKK